MLGLNALSSRHTASRSFLYQLPESWRSRQCRKIPREETLSIGSEDGILLRHICASKVVVYNCDRTLPSSETTDYDIILLQAGEGAILGIESTNCAPVNESAPEAKDTCDTVVVARVDRLLSAGWPHDLAESDVLPASSLPSSTIEAV